MRADFVVIGGGIAGVSCAKELSRLCDKKVILISSSSTVVESSSIFKVTHHLESITVFEKTSECFKLENPRIEIVLSEVIGINVEQKFVILRDKTTIAFDRLCIAAGAVPKSIHCHENVINIRGGESVDELVSRLSASRKVAIVGNGGISLELAHEVKHCHIDWIVKDNYIGSAFFDASASEFIMPSLLKRARHTTNNCKGNVVGYSSAIKDETTNNINNSKRKLVHCTGYALGPDWIQKSTLSQHLKDTNSITNESEGSLKMHFEQEVVLFSDDHCKTWKLIDNSSKGFINVDNNHVNNNNNLEELILKAKITLKSQQMDVNAYKLYVMTSKYEIVGCDFLISATGVKSNNHFIHHNNIRKSSDNNVNITNIQNNNHVNSNSSNDDDSNIQIKCNDDGYIIVSECFQTNIPYIYAAGDCIDYQPVDKEFIKEHAYYFQMRLWSQARVMGIYTAHCMLNKQEDYGLDSQFELFAHITRFFGYKVVMLGRYNAQGLGNKIERITKEMIVTKEGLKPNDYFTEITEYQHTNNMTENTTNTSNSNRDNDNIIYQESKVEFWIRITGNEEYIKLVIYESKIIGALLIGDTELEEVMENLILNQLNVSQLGIGILDPSIDIADYFD